MNAANNDNDGQSAAADNAAADQSQEQSKNKNKVSDEQSQLQQQPTANFTNDSALQDQDESSILLVKPKNQPQSQSNSQINNMMNDSKQNSYLEPLIDKSGGDNHESVELAHFGGDQQRITLLSNTGRSSNDRVHNRSFSQMSTTSIGASFNPMRSQVNKSGVGGGIQLKMRQTWCDHFKIFMYHYIEPVLLAISMGLCLQLPTLSTLIYVIAMFLGILPLVLTNDRTNIKFKWFLCCLMAICALPLFIFKLFMIIQYKKDSTKFDSQDEMWKFLGVFTDKPGVTLTIDILQMVICIMLIFVLNDQKNQATKRLQVLQRLAYQTEIKLHHPYFGGKYMICFTIAYSLYLMDTFIMMSIPQLFVIILLIIIMLFWNRIVVNQNKWLFVMLRFIQILTIIQALSGFFLQLPIVADNWQKSHYRMINSFGLMGFEDVDNLTSKDYETYARFHMVTLCFAVVSTEVFIVSHKVQQRQVKRIQEVASISANQPQSPLSQISQHRGRYSIDRTNNFQRQTTVSVLNARNTKLGSGVSGMWHSEYNQKHISQDQQHMSRLHRSKLLTQKSATMSIEENSWYKKLLHYWKNIRGAIPIWLCRLICFLWVYIYHDIQSVFLLIWIVHSTLFKDSLHFRKWIIFCYLPLVISIFLWYYIINIFGLLPRFDDPDKTDYKYIDNYTFGFFKFQIPVLEIFFMFCGVASFCALANQLARDSENKKFEEQLRNKIGNKTANLGYQFLFLFLRYIEYPLMVFLVIAGLDKMDVYHIAMLLFFVWYTLQPQIIQKWSIYLLLYADAFLIEKYVYSLVYHAKNDPANWIEIIGFSTDYNEHSTKEYWRYPPRFDQWVLVALTFCLYRRQQLLGTDDKVQFAEYTRQAENQIKLRMPRFYRFCIVMDIIYTYTIVMIAFTLYLVIIILIPASLINCFSQTLVLILLCIYLSSGIKKLLGYWNLLIFYQAIVLVLMVVFQFMVQSPGWENSKLHTFFTRWPSWWQTWLKWLGFVKYEDPINLKLLPYVIFFSLAVILHENFKNKNTIERRQLYTSQDIQPHNHASGTNHENQQNQITIVQSPQQIRLSNLHLSSLDVNNAETLERLAQNSKQIENLMRMDPTGDYQKVEPDLVYNYGRVSGICKDTSEILHHKQTMNMKYKMSYLVYKMRKVWPILDTIAAYFYLVVFVTILAFALYFQLALFWAIALTIYMASQFINSNQNWKYRQNGFQKFNQKLLNELLIESHEAAAIQLNKSKSEQEQKQKLKKIQQKRLLLTEDQTLANRQTISQLKFERKIQLKEIRQSKQGFSPKTSYTKFDPTNVTASGGIDSSHLSARFGGNINDSNDPQNVQQYFRNDQINSLLQSNNNNDAEDDFENLESMKEGKSNRRIKVTDKEAIEEFQEFVSEIHQVTLRSRYFSWYCLMILLVIGLALIYISSFAHLYENESSSSPFSSQTKQRIIFFFFWAGVYSDDVHQAYAQAVYPFYVVLILLIIERLAQLWTEKRFGCSEEMIQKFKQVEQEDKIYANLAKERKKVSEKSTYQAKKSQRIRSGRQSIASASEKDKDENLSQMSDSFKTDSDMQKSKADNASKSLVTIEELKSESLRDSYIRSSQRAQSVKDAVPHDDQLNNGDKKIEAPGSSTSINQSYREKPQLELVEDAEKLVEESKKKSSKKQKKLIFETDNVPQLVVDSSAKITEVTMEDDLFSSWEKRDEMKQKLLEELKPVLNVKSKVKLYRALKCLLENLCILLVWFSCIYKQNILSIVIFIVLIIYTYHRSGTTLLIVRATIVIMFVLQYWFEVLNLSTYNSPKEFPSHLIGQNSTVYPNPTHYYYDVPLFFSYDQSTSPDGTLSAKANLYYTSYLAMDADNRKLNGIWIDFAMTVTVAVYFSVCNFWMLFRPVKVVRSDETDKKLKQYAKIMRIESEKKNISIKHVTRDLKQQFGLSKLIKVWSESLYETFPILLIAFTLAISIFNQSILSFGYIIFVMILVFDNINFLKSENSQDRLRSILKYFMLPYLLLDILLQLIYQMPFQQFETTQNWSSAVGFDRVWKITPATLILGQNLPDTNNKVIYSIDTSLASMMLKGVTFFFISIQLQLLGSYQYQKYMQFRCEKEQEWKEKAGYGITYRFNNFKSKSVLKHAKETQRVESMLWHVKRLIRKRQELFKRAQYRQNSIVGNNMIQKERRGSVQSNHHLKEIQEQDQYSSHSDSDHENYQKRLEHRVKVEKGIIKKDYEKKMAQLGCCNKLYLWIRRNYVVDILFRKSEEQLDDFVNQMKNGRTNIKTSVEIGIHNRSKKERQHEIEQQLNALLFTHAQKTQERKATFHIKKKDLDSEESSDELLKDKQIHDDDDKKGGDVDSRDVSKQEIVEESKEPKIVEETKEMRTSSQSALATIMDTTEKNPRDSYDFNNRLDNLINNIDQQEEMKNQKFEKQLYADLLKSKVYRVSNKPWEVVNLDNFLSWKRTLSRYLVVFYKSFVSYSELLCYVMMLLATFMKAGWLYMVYPISIFGYCMCEEQRPGKIFWFFILFYTQALIILNFMMQLQVWDELLSEEQKQNYQEFFYKNTLGIRKIDGNSFSDTFTFYFPEIFILFTVLIHIQKESLSGVFNVPYESYENFEQGLLRYRLQVLCNTEAERKQVIAQFNQEEALNIVLNKKTINEYRVDSGNMSEGDKFKRSEQLGDPIRREMLFKDPLLPFAGEPDLINDFVYNAKGQSHQSMSETDADDEYMDRDTGGPEQLDPLQVLLDEYHQVSPEEVEEAKADRVFWVSEDNYLYRNKGKNQGKFDLLKWVQWLFIDNSFMNRLFPDIKQQKPGKDMYVYVATIQIIMIAYVFLFYSNMQGNESDITTQFSSNQYSSGMVLLVIAMMFVMIVDRIFYSTHALMSGIVYDTHGEIGQQTTNQNAQNQENSGENSLVGAQMQDSDTSMLHRQSGQPYARRTQALYTVDTEKKQTRTQNNWIEEQFVLSDDSSDDDPDQFQYNQNLIPQKQQRTFTRVMKFYWFWFVIIISHYFIFFGLPSTLFYCMNTVQLNTETNTYVYYGDPGYNCNTFQNNGWIITFYLMLCLYLTIQAYQMRIGLPEVRKGSFLMETFNPVSGVVYRGYLAIPFIFELRTLIDWTFTTTALDAFQWIKLAQIQANMYVAKCVNKDYMERELGTRIKKWEKIVVGFGLVIFILFMIVGPIILFSSLNPIAIIDNPTGGQLKATLSYKDIDRGTNQTLSLFQTSQVTQIKQMTQAQYDGMNFNNNTETTAVFGLNQIQIVQFSATSDVAWIISKPKKEEMIGLLQNFANGTLTDNYELVYSFEYTFDRENDQYGSASGYVQGTFNSSSDYDKQLAQTLANQIDCTESNLNATFPNGITITQKTNQENSASKLLTDDDALKPLVTLNYQCNSTNDDMSDNYWSLRQTFSNSTDPDVQEEVQYMEENIFYGEGFGFFLFQQKVMPGFFGSYSANLIVFYIGIVYVVATLFRSAFVPRTWEIFIIDAPFTEDILKICQSIHVYRVQRELEKEEELYQILIDIMRSPEMIKALCGSSLKKKLQ